MMTTTTTMMTAQMVTDTGIPYPISNSGSGISGSGWKTFRNSHDDGGVGVGGGGVAGGVGGGGLGGGGFLDRYDNPYADTGYAERMAASSSSSSSYPSSYSSSSSSFSSSLSKGQDYADILYTNSNNHSHSHSTKNNSTSPGAPLLVPQLYTPTYAYPSPLCYIIGTPLYITTIITSFLSSPLLHIPRSTSLTNLAFVLLQIPPVPSWCNSLSQPTTAYAYFVALSHVNRVSLRCSKGGVVPSPPPPVGVVQ